MFRQGTSFTLSDADRVVLTARVRSQTGEKRHAFRAQIVLMAADGRTNVEIASALRTRTATASRWRTRFAKGGVEALIDKPRPGKVPVYGTLVNTWQKSAFGKDLKSIHIRLMTAITTKPISMTAALQNTTARQEPTNTK